MAPPIVPVRHGSGWLDDRGRAVADYLYRVREDVDTVMRAVADVPDAVLLTGEVTLMRALLGPEADVMVRDAARTRSSKATCAFRLEHVAERIAAVNAPEDVAHLRAAHEARGEGRAVVVVLRLGTCIVKIVPETVEVEVDADPGAVVRGGLA